MADPQPMPSITAAPAYKGDRSQLTARTTYDFSDYGFVIPWIVSEAFEIVPVNVDDQQAFIFMFPREDIAEERYSLFNLHAFLKFTGTVEEFAHSRGQSVATIELSPSRAYGVEAMTYKRQIAMSNLFKGAEQVITFIGGRPDLLVSDSHTYFTHRHNHYYSGMIHMPGNDERYDALRSILFANIRLV
jgi:hypothetical protein